MTTEELEKIEYRVCNFEEDIRLADYFPTDIRSLITEVRRLRDEISYAEYWGMCHLKMISESNPDMLLKTIAFISKMTETLAEEGER